jgi:hypothetical protein
VAVTAPRAHNDYVRTWVVLGAAAAVAAFVAVGVAYGFHGVVVLAFFAFVVGALGFGLRAGGDIVRRASAARFDDDRRR